MVSREGFEPSTPGLRGPCSNQLSYRPRRYLWILQVRTTFRQNDIQQKDFVILPDKTTQNKASISFLCDARQESYTNQQTQIIRQK